MKQIEKLIFISLWKLDDWGLYNRRNEAILNELAKRETVESVLHVEHIPLSRLFSRLFKYFRSKDKLLKRVYGYQIRKALSPGPIPDFDDRKRYLYSVVDLYSGPAAPLKRLSCFLRKLQYGAINRHFRRHGKIILIAYPPMRYLQEAISAIRHNVLLADLVDDDVERTTDLNKKKERLENYRKILAGCSWTFTTSPALNERYVKFAATGIEFLPNAVDISDYARVRPAETNGKGRKVVGYVGAINRSMDTELMEHLLTEFPSTDFILIGFCRREQVPDIARFRKNYKNFSFLGERNYREIPAFLSGCDVLISFKKVDCRTKGNDSMKIYEYLATGKPVVTTPVHPAEQFRDMIYIADNKRQFVECLKLALAENDDAVREMRRKAAEENSWAKRVDIILNRTEELNTWN